jgi:hypothetical protein
MGNRVIRVIAVIGSRGVGRPLADPPRRLDDGGRRAGQMSILSSRTKHVAEK